MHTSSNNLFFTTPLGVQNPPPIFIKPRRNAKIIIKKLNKRILEVQKLFYKKVLKEREDRVKKGDDEFVNWKSAKKYIRDKIS